MSKTSKPRATMLFCFALAGLWAGSVVTYTVVSINPDVMQTAEVNLTQEENSGRFFNRDGTPRTTPYDPGTAPPFIERDGTVRPGVEDVVPGDFEFPEPIITITPATPVVPPVVEAPVVEAPAVDESPVVDEPETPQTDIFSGAFSALQRLFNGEGNFSDIINIAIAAFAIFGGAQFGSSDMLFKVVLGLFSKKGNFNDILEARLGPATTRRSRRRSRK